MLVGLWKYRASSNQSYCKHFRYEEFGKRKILQNYPIPILVRIFIIIHIFHLSNPIQLYPTIFKHYHNCPTLSNPVKSCQNLSNPVNNCPNLSKPVKHCPNLSEPVINCQIYPSLSNTVQTVNKLFKPIQTY